MSFDIYKYFNSKDIAEYCQRIGKNFSLLEQAAILTYSHKSLKARIDAYSQLAEEILIYGGNTGSSIEAKTLANWLANLASASQKAIDSFVHTKPEEVFMVAINGVAEYQIFRTFQDASLRILEMKDELEEARRESTTPWYIEVLKTDYDGMWCGVRVLTNGMIFNMDHHEKFIIEDRIRVNARLQIPNPFKKGDLVQLKTPCGVCRVGVLEGFVDKNRNLIYPPEVIEDVDHMHCQIDVGIDGEKETSFGFNLEYCRAPQRYFVSLS